MRELRAAFPKTIPVLFGYVFLGITYGILMATNGFPLWLPILTAAVIYTGSMEFLLVSILMSAFNPLSAFVTALMVGARHLFYGIAMLPKYRGSGPLKFYLIYTTSDETFALNYDAEIPEGLNAAHYYFFVSLLDQCYWIAGAAIGGLCGSLIHFNTEGLDFVMTAMFVSIFMNQWLKDRDGKQSHAPELIGVGCAALSLAIFGADRFIVPAMILILAVLALGKKKLEKAGAEEVSGGDQKQKEGSGDADDRV